MRSTLRLTAFFFLWALIALRSAHAATSFEVSGWIPYWRTATGTADAMAHLSTFTTINPFGYTMKSDGTLYDAADITQEPWTSLIAAAHAKKIRVIPTVMWGNGASIDATLRDTKKRQALEDQIAGVVMQNNVDGIDIDFEAKEAQTKDYFSTFLKGLYQRMGTKWVMCDIESRTPLDARYYGSSIPPDATVYANDFKAINKYCDRVRLMTYDQESVDKTLNNAAGNTLYSPVSDPKWDTAVIQLAVKSISPKKLELGVATYGYEYDVTPYANTSGWMYDLLWSFNPGYATQLENLFHVMPTRNTAGELAFTYTPTSTPATIPSGTGTATPTSPNQTASIGTAVANAADSNALTGTQRYVTWSDAVAIAQKVALAKKLGIRGIAIFKLDGGEDPGMWSVVP